MSNLKTIIVEDEKKNREMLRKMVELYCPEVTIAGTADSVESAIALIGSVQPDIILMDIELHPGTCFDVFPHLAKLDFEIIFTTAYKDYAIEAIKVGALEYLLKPINKKELKTAIDKAIKKLSTKDENVNLKQFLSRYKQGVSARISLNTTDGIIYAEVDQILRCEANGSYTNIYFRDLTKHITSRPLKEYESSLNTYSFFRVHNSHLISLAEVKKYLKTDGGFVEMKDGSQIPVSNSHKEAFLEAMRQFSINS